MNKVINIVSLITLIPIFVGSIFLQIILSKNKNKFLGLILPIISFLMSLVLIIMVFNFAVGTKTKVNEQNIYGETTSYANNNNNERNIGTIIFITVFINIPTFIYLGIYFCYTKHRSKLLSNRNELMKMNIQDLE